VPGVILHITTSSAWQQALALGRYEPSSLRADGYIHFSEIEQVTTVADAAFSGVAGLVLLCVARDRLTAALQYESSAPDDEQFPHLYGPLNLDAVLSVVPFAEGAHGFVLPREVRSSDTTSEANG
jgi:uncharacterized protein (DUF952 family)